MKIENILVAGAGALGALYGHKFLAKNKNIFFLADGKRKKRLETDGLIVNGKKYPVKCIDGNSQFKPDLVLIAVKYHNLPEIIEQIKNMVADETIIISVLNGIDSEEIIKNSLNKGKILISVPLGMDAVRDGNATVFTNEGKLLFGHFDDSTSENDMQRLKELFRECRIAWETPSDIRHVMWFKFMINTGINQVSAILNANYEFMRSNIYAKELMDETMLEVIKVANAEGVDLSGSDLTKWYGILASLGAEGKTSMCQDTEAKRKTEVEMLSGKMMELGQKHNIDVTINKVLYNLIKAKESL